MSRSNVGVQDAPRLALNSALRQWLECEQTLNERLDHDEDGRVRIVLDHSRLPRAYRAETGAVWPQEVVWLPRAAARAYGRVTAEFATAFERVPPSGTVPLLIHPQSPAAHRRAKRDHGAEILAGVFASPTASARTVVAQYRERVPVCLKLSVGNVLSGVRRSLPERDILSSLVISRLLETIPDAARKAAGLAWFPETAGAVAVDGGSGWLLRHFPPAAKGDTTRGLIPAFSLISRKESAPPLLVELIAESGLRAEEYVLEKVIRPYVRALAFLLFEEGIHTEGHMQNVLFGFDRATLALGPVILRDLSDMSVDVPHRVARRKPLPRLEDLKRDGVNIRVATVAADHRCGRLLPSKARGSTTVERYGLRGFVWALNRSLSRFYPRYRCETIEGKYREFWRAEARRNLHAPVKRSEEPIGSLIDEAIFHFQQRTFRDGGWDSEPARVEREAEALFPQLDLRGFGGRYHRMRCDWGNLYLLDGIPMHFAPERGL